MKCRLRNLQQIFKKQSFLTSLEQLKEINISNQANKILAHLQKGDPKKIIYQLQSGHPQFVWNLMFKLGFKDTEKKSETNQEQYELYQDVGLGAVGSRDMVKKNTCAFSPNAVGYHRKCVHVELCQTKAITSSITPCL